MPSQHTYKGFYKDIDMTIKASCQWEAMQIAIEELEVPPEEVDQVSVRLTRLDTTNVVLIDT